MAEYKELIARIDDAFKNDKKLKINASDIEHLSNEEIQKIQDRINSHSLLYINRAEEKNIIDAESAENLRKIYRNSPKIIKILENKICYTIMNEYRSDKVKKLQELNEDIGPEEIHAIDLSNGKIEENPQGSEYKNMPKYKEYQAKHITPFTSMRLTFYDFRDNPIYVIMPGIKDVRRAIDKIKLPVYDKEGKIVSRGGKYHEQYQKEQKKIRAKIEAQTAAKYEKDSEEYKKELEERAQELEEKLSACPKPYQRLKDMVRFTVCRKYYQDTEETLQLFKKENQYAVQDSEIKDTFHGNKNNSQEYETKNYREKRVYLNMEGIKVEVQIKIITLYEGDFDTHEIYAGEENEEGRDDNILLISQENTRKKGLRFWEENINRYLTEGDKKLVKMKILEKRLAAQQRNKQSIRRNNLQVIDKAFRIEDAKRAHGKDYDNYSYNSSSGKIYPIYQTSANFIRDNFMYRPFKSYDMEKNFNAENEELKSMGLVINEDQLTDMSNRYAEFILPKYNGRISGNEVEYFSQPEHQEEIRELFQRYAYNEQPQPEIVPDQDEIEMLQELEREPLDSQKYNKILAKKQRYYHNKEQLKNRIKNQGLYER